MTVGWYVHHHGSGHLHRFLAARAHLPEVVAFSSLPRPRGLSAEEWVELPLDVSTSGAADDDPRAGGALHWVPLGDGGLRERMAAIAAWIALHRPEAFVCDVSVEVATLVRLLGVPVVWIAQRGRRVDAPHRLAYRFATVVAPWTAAVASPASGLPDGTVQIGALSRFDDRTPTPPPGRRRALLLVGRGGHAIHDDDVRAAIAASAGWTWAVVGLDGPGAPDPWELLCDCDVVVGTAGGGIVAEVAAARRPFVCLPQERPFDEQRDAAAALAAAGLAEAFESWPSADRWPAILERALGRDPDGWSRLHDGRAGDRLGDVIREIRGRPLEVAA